MTLVLIRLQWSEVILCISSLVPAFSVACAYRKWKKMQLIHNVNITLFLEIFGSDFKIPEASAAFWNSTLLDTRFKFTLVAKKEPNTPSSFWNVLKAFLRTVKCSSNPPSPKSLHFLSVYHFIQWSNYVVTIFVYQSIGLEKVSFHSNPKERQCQRMLEPHNCTHLTH